MFKVTRKIRWLLGAVVTLLLIGCSAEVEKSLRVGTNLWPGYETLYLARERGYFEGSPVHLVELSSATDVMHAFRNDVLEVAALTLDEALTLLQTETDLQIILVMDSSSGADVLLAKPAIQRLSDLKGKRIAVENNAVGALLLARALEVAKLSMTEVEIVPATVSGYYELYKQGKVDAVVTFDPVRTQLMKEGAEILFDSGDIPGQIVDVLVARKSLIANRPEALQALVDGQFKALDYLFNYPKEAAKVIAPRLAITPAELTEGYKGMVLPGQVGNSRFMSGDKPELEEIAEELVFMMLEKKLLFKRPQLDELITDQFL
jgi:NitT/TauT family transport system substrate-binding protein